MRIMKIIKVILLFTTISLFSVTMLVPLLLEMMRITME
jgi:hypothetical protein